jgi:hypothetical protein
MELSLELETSKNESAVERPTAIAPRKNPPIEKTAKGDDTGLIKFSIMIN